MDEKEFKLKEERALIWLPDTALRVELVVDVYINGMIAKVSQELDFEKIKKAFRDAENYIGDEDTFILTEKGKSLLEELR